jgi:hypothetical protein
VSGTTSPTQRTSAGEARLNSLGLRSARSSGRNEVHIDLQSQPFDQSELVNRDFQRRYNWARVDDEREHTIKLMPRQRGHSITTRLKLVKHLTQHALQCRDPTSLGLEVPMRLLGRPTSACRRLANACHVRGVERQESGDLRRILRVTSLEGKGRASFCVGPLKRVGVSRSNPRQSQSQPSVRRDELTDRESCKDETRCGVSEHASTVNANWSRTRRCAARKLLHDISQHLFKVVRGPGPNFRQHDLAAVNGCGRRQLRYQGPSFRMLM